MMFNEDTLVNHINDYSGIPSDLIKVNVYDVPFHCTVVKYTGKGYFGDYWDEYPQLRQARGHIFDSKTGNCIARPFDKVPDYREVEHSIRYSDPVEAVRKVNGFLGVVTPIQENFLYSTTGTIDSHYAFMVRKHTQDLNWKRLFNFNDSLRSRYTYMFEICDESDPHITDEAYGPYLIGCRCVDTGNYMTETQLDMFAEMLGCRRPSWKMTYMDSLLDEVQRVTHEGFMVTDHTGTTFKLKSPYYSFLKAVARMGKKRVESNWTDGGQEIAARFGEDSKYFYAFEDLIKEWSIESWIELSEQDRLMILKGRV